MVGSEVRQPELSVLANGRALPGIIDVEVSSNAYLCANRFTVRVAISGSLPEFWTTLPLLIEIQAGLDGAWQSLITGNADSITLDPIQREAVLQGRDLTALLVTAQTAETFENRTASEIATVLANRHGLTPVVTATSDLVGRYYQSGRTSSSLSQHARSTSEWDVLTSMADREGFDVWVDGHQLFFQPAGIAAGSVSLSPADCTSIRLHRMFDLAAGPTVLVQSWDSHQGSAISGKAASGGQGGPTFTTLRPNLSAVDATQLAQRTLAQLTSHAEEVEFDMPGDLVTMPRTILSLSDTGSDFDGLYTIVETERRISFQDGFTQSVVAKAMPWTVS